VASLVPVTRRKQPRDSSKVRRSGLALALMSLAIVLALPFVPVGAANAADQPVLRYDQTDTHIVKAGDWSDYDKPAAYGGSYGRSDTSGATATVWFNGTQIDWIAMKGTTTGTADVYLDGTKTAGVDLAAPSAVYQQDVWQSPALSAGLHSLKIVNTSGKYLTLDAVDITGTIAYAPPAITGISPSAGSVNGGTSVTITGTSLFGATSVTFGGTAATNVSVNAAGTKLTCTAPAHAAAAVTVEVTTPSGKASTSYTYQVVLDIVRYDQSDERIDHTGAWDTFDKAAAYKGAYDRADTKGDSATVYFKGTSLAWIAMKGTSTGTADVYLDGVFQKTVNLASSSASYQVTVWSTGNISNGQHHVTISRAPSCPAGKFITLDAVDVGGTLIYSPPVVTGLMPASGSTAGGASVVITGTGLTDASAVTFGGVAATSFTVESDTLITAAAPAHGAGAVGVKVTTPSGSSPDTSADDYLYAVATTPTITGIAPASGPAGATVAITGTGFIGVAGPAAVTFGGANAASYTVDSPTHITAVAPSHDPGKVQVKVKAAGGTTADTSADDFTFLTRYDQTDSRFSYGGAWEAYSTAAAWKGSYARTSTSGGSVTLTFAGTRLTWIAMKGTTTGQADVYLDGVFQSTVDLAAPTPTYQQAVWSTPDLSNAPHTVKIVRNSQSASGTFLTVDAVEVVGTLLGTGRIEQADAHLAYAGTWSTVSASGASGGSYKRASGSGTTVYVDFTGVELAWIATKGAGMGKARVSVDGGTAQSVDLAAGSTAYKQKVWDSGPLTLGDHEVKISWDTSNASGAYLTVDAFDLVGSLRQAYLWYRYEQTDLRLLFSDSWSTVSASGASGGSYKQTNSASATLDFLFTGRGFNWIASTGPGMGKAQISIDGGSAVTVDLSSSAAHDQQKVWSSPELADGLHRVQIGVSATSAAGASIDVDAVDVHGSLPSVSSTTAAKTMWAEQRLKELSYLPGAVDGVSDSKTKGAVIAFEKWEGLSRDGVVGTTVWARLHTAARPKPTRSGTTDPWIEVDKTKQVLLFCQNGAVKYTIPVSTGSADVGMITPSGTFSIYSKTPPRGHLYYPMAITSAIAIHGYPTVPTTPASHGCVRTQDWDQDVLYPITPLGTRVYIY
jgi:hypothetical protein